jgi:hypothetical protein
MAAIHLVHKVNTALRETDGASSQYNQTISGLQGLEGLLRCVQSAHSADVDPQQLYKLQLLGHECYIPTQQILVQDSCPRAQPREPRYKKRSHYR